MKNRMTMNQLSTYLPFWEEMEKRLSKSIERKDLAEVQSILNRAYMKALEVGFEEGVKNSVHNMENQNIINEEKGNDVNHVLATVLDVIKEIPQQGQVQYDLQRQLRELRTAANKLGLYDAADFLRPHCG